MSDSRPFGGDISVYDGMLDMVMLATHPMQPRFLGIQATISYSWSNKFFGYQWSGALEQGLPPLPYHVTYPKETGIYAAPVIKQLENIFRTAPDPGAGRVIDLELDHNGSLDTTGPAPATQIADVNGRIVEAVRAHDGEWPVLYSRKNLIEAWLGGWTTTFLNSLWHWLAQYLYDRTREDPGPLRLPARLDPARVIIHQTADKVPSAQFGVRPGDAREFDTDRWVGQIPLSDWLARRDLAIPKSRVEIRHPANVEIVTVEV